jgi:2-dehydropantoate 2-reductase
MSQVTFRRTARVTDSASSGLTGPGRHLGFGQITLGDLARCLCPVIHELARKFEACGIPCRTVEDLQAARWEKRFWNIPFNALCRLTGKPVSAILSSADSVARVRDLMAEVLRAAAACGHPLPDDLPALLLGKTERTGTYRPSTTIDFKLGREIELETIWGEPLRRGQAAGVQMPLRSQLYRELRDAIRRRDATADVRHERVVRP